MKTNVQKTNKKIWLVAIAALLFLVMGAQTAQAQWATNGNNINNTNSGNVGIGTANPISKLQVNRAVRIDDDSGSATGSDTLGGSPLLYLGTTGGGAAFQFNGSGGIDLWQYSPGWARTVTFTKGGNVGIGTTNPTSLEGNSRLTVQASDSVANYLGIINSGSGQAGLALRRTGGTASRWVWYLPPGSTEYHLFYGDGVVANSGDKLVVSENGNVTISGNINAKYQDVAEWVPSSERLAAGTVVVLDSTKSNHVISSNVSYDTRVAGVISAQPGIALGEKSDNKVLVATTGRVRVKVDATRAPIHIGDLLVTSDIPGVAMKSEPIEIGGRKMHMPGTLIGKALEPLAKGSGEILVLLSLQ